VRLVRWADQHKPRGWQRFIAPAVALGLAGVVSVWFPEILGNGKDLSQLLFTDQVGLRLGLALLFLKPLATITCIRSGVPGACLHLHSHSALCWALRWARLERVLAGHADWIFCAAWRGRGPGRDYPGAGVIRGAADGAYRQGPVVHFAAYLGCRNLDIDLPLN